MINSSYNLNPPGKNHISNFSEKEGIVKGSVYKVGNKINSSQELYIKTKEFLINSKKYSTSGNIQLTVVNADNKFTDTINPGDEIFAEVFLKKPDLPNNFGEFNYREYLKRQKVYLTSFIDNNQIGVHKKGNKFNYANVLYIIKEKINQKIDLLYAPPNSSLIKAMIIGNRNNIAGEWLDIFQDAGIMHILAISGLHVGLIALFLMFILNLFNKNPQRNIYKHLIVTIVLIGYAAIAGFRPSVSRAVIMFSIFVFAKYLNRPYHLFNSLYLSALLLLLWQPLYLFDSGFLLSFVITFFIVLLSPIIEEKTYILPDYFKKSLSLSLAAWLGLLPLSAYFFYKISIIAIFSNLIIIPIISIILTLSIISILFSFFIPQLAIFISWFVNLFSNVFLAVSEFLSSIPFAYQYVAKPKIYSIILYYILLFFIFTMLYSWPDYNFYEKKKRLQVLVTILIVFIAINIFSPSALSVHFINVGQGDCILIKIPQNKIILIDGGGTPFNDFDVGKNIVIPYLRKEGIKKIDIVFLTHPDLDHLEGLLPILKEIKVKTVIDNGNFYDNTIFKEYISIIRNKKIFHYQTNFDDIIKINSSAELFVLNPTKTDNKNNETDFNNNSIVLKLKYKDSRFLFTGDIEKESEFKILDLNIPIKSDILKVAHHGSNSSTADLFLEQVNPKVAIISVGSNSFGHPHENVLNKLDQQCKEIYRTDITGTIIIKTYGSNYYINTLRKNNEKKY